MWSRWGFPRNGACLVQTEVQSKIARGPRGGEIGRKSGMVMVMVMVMVVAVVAEKREITGVGVRCRSKGPEGRIVMIWKAAW